MYDFEALDALARKFLIKRKTHKEREIGACYFHGQRVANSVLKLRPMILADDSKDECLRIAGMFHDIGKGIEPHEKYGALLAHDILSDIVKSDDLDFVCALIASHPDRRPGYTDLNVFQKLVQDADLLDHYGTQGLWMSFTYYAYEGQQEMMQLPIFYDEEWPKQIERHRKLLNFDVSKAIFDEKVTFERAVIDRIKLEGKGDYCDIK